MNINSEKIEVDVAGSAMSMYVSVPDGDAPRPSVLLFMEIFGVNAYIRSVVHRVAEQGYVVGAPDLFHRSAPGIELAYDDDGLTKGIGLMGGVKRDELEADILAAYEHLRARPDTTEAVGAMGFCFGGHAAYLAACKLPIAATASFYGGGVAGAPMGGSAEATVDLSAAIKGKILCLFGDQDVYISADDVATVRRALVGNGIDHQIEVYAGAGHGFFCDARADFNKAAADDAWTKVKDLFAAELQ